MRLVRFSLFVALMLGSVPAQGAPEGRAAEAAHERLDDALVKQGLSFGRSAYVRIFKEEAELDDRSAAPGASSWCMATAYRSAVSR